MAFAMKTLQGYAIIEVQKLSFAISDLLPVAVHIVIKKTMIIVSLVHTGSQIAKKQIVLTALQK